MDGSLVDLLLNIATVALVIYTIAVAVFIVSENRTPQSTFAWLLLLVALPIVGLGIYIFLGRGKHAFSKETDLAGQEMGSDLERDLGGLVERQQDYINRIEKEKPASYHPRILNLVKQNSPSALTGYNDIEILQDATMKYPRLLEDIKAAQSSVHLNYYIWTEDKFTLQIKEALIERAKAGIEVRCLYDQSGGMMSKQYIQDLTDGGVEIHPYLEFRSLSQLHTVNYRSHRKIAVIDGKIGYVGGLNLDVEQIEPPAFDRWRDTHLRMVGEAAWALQGSFIISWFNTTKQKISGPKYFPPVETKNFMPVQLIQSGPDSEWSAIRQLYFLMIMSAEKKLYMQSPFFIPDESILEALKAAALAGVDVQLMFTPRGSTYQIPYRAAHTYFKDVAAAGAKVYLYEAGYFHPKTLNVDNAVISIGTANMDIRSFSLNYEASAVVYDEGKAKELEAQFLEDLKHCKQWTLEEYESYSAFHRFVDSVYRLSSPVL
jgi:cardiolipin synthase